MHHRCADDVLLAAGDHHAVVSALDDLDRSGGVVDRGGDSEVLVATARREPFEARAVFGIGGREHVGDGCQGHAAGRGGGGAVARQEHLHLGAQLVLGARHPVHRIHLVDGRVVGARHPVHRLAQEELFGDIVDALAVEPDRTPVPQRLSVSVS